MHLSNLCSRQDVLAEESELRQKARDKMAARIAELRRQGLGTPDIATRLGISRRNVVKQLSAAGLTKPRAARTRADA